MSPRFSAPTLALLLGVIPSALWALCPEAELDHAREAELFEELKAAPDHAAAGRINGALWELWTTAPDPAAQKMLDSGMARLRRGDLATAHEDFDALVAYCPDYAEGYNQRAFAFYLQQSFAPALEDLDRALARSPNHVGAHSGRALTLMGLGRDAEALEALRLALTLNPWLSERALVPVLEERLGAKDL